MRKIHLIYSALIFVGIFKINGQEPIIFKGKLGSIKDTAYYYLDNNANKLNLIGCDLQGNYSFSLDSKKTKKLTIYYTDYKECAQVIDLENVRKQNNILKTNEIINDLPVIKGYACIRDLKGITENEVNIFGGMWQTSNGLTLNVIEYKMEILENGIKFMEEGEPNFYENKVVLESIYLRNLEINTYIEVKREHVFNLVDGKLVSTEGIIYEKMK